MKRIYILSGSIKSRKTTSLIKWINGKQKVDGILQPVINGKRFLQHISSGENRQLEISGKVTAENEVEVGKYKFDKNVFSWAQEKLLYAYREDLEWLVIDEFGKLELIGNGLEPAISKIINEKAENSKANIIIIIRDYLVNEFISKYKSDLTEIQFLDL
ncbi:MAG: hypothetical protein MUO34_13190 [Ignavibacteriaceae bacterium]|nr:hypothetical protein [Ignavibacteriaceae bacterium]